MFHCPKCRRISSSVGGLIAFSALDNCVTVLASSPRPCMTRRVFHLHLNAIFCSALMIWPVARADSAAGPMTTNQSVSSGTDSPASLLTTAEQIHRLTRSEAERGQRVRIRGVITSALPAFEAAVVQDATSGIYVDHWNSSLGV